MDRFPLHLIPVTIEQAWGLLEYDWELRLHLLAPELSQEFQPKLNAIYQGKKRSDSHYIRARIELELEQAEYTAKRYFEACCEEWDAQHRPRCRAFFRAVLDFVLIPSFDQRQSITFGDIGGCYPNEPNLSVVLGDFKRRLDKVRSRWATRIEKAIRQNEYDQQKHREMGLQQPQLTPAPPAERIGALDGTFTWKELASRFQDMQAKVSAHQSVSAEWTQTVWETGTVNEEWSVRGNPAMRADFIGLASIAAQKLGHARCEDAYKTWLGRVWKWMQEVGLDKDKQRVWCPVGSGTEGNSSYTTKHLFTENIADLSARFCLRLIATDAPDLAVSTNSESEVPGSDVTLIPHTGKRVGRKPKRDAAFCDLARSLFEEERSRCGKLTDDGLKRVAHQFEKAGFAKPAEYLEKEARKALNDYNRQFGASHTRKIMTWTALVEIGDKDQKRAMRKLLYRCAAMSGNDLRTKKKVAKKAG